MKEVKTKEKPKQPRRKRISTPFAQNLKQTLEERGLSIRGAAEIMGCNPAMVHSYLQGTQPHDSLAVLKLCRALKCDYQWLMTGTHPETTVSEMSLKEIFEMESDPAFSGIFQIEAKRLKRRSDDGGKK